jgi:hypothetical protein
LRRADWSVEELPNEVRLIPPGTVAPDLDIDQVLGSQKEAVEGDSAEAAFGLEFQLRDFIASNIKRIDVGGNRLRVYVDP